MSINVTSPVTGAAQTGLTSPTYTVTPDVAPPGNPGEQVAVIALGGTQVGVTIHSVSSPFTSNFTRPAIYKQLGLPNPVSGIVSNVPNNTCKIITRKGVTPGVGQPTKVMIMTTTVDTPAGAETYDAANCRAGLSLHFGVTAQQSAGFGDLVVQGIL